MSAARRGHSFAPDAAALEHGIPKIREGDGFFADRELSVCLFEDEAFLGNRDRRDERPGAGSVGHG